MTQINPAPPGGRHKVRTAARVRGMTDGGRATVAQQGKIAMKALMLYVLFVLIGSAISVAVGYYVEKEISSAVSLIVFLSMFFANFAVSWILTILVMDGSLKNAQGALDQREAEKIGKASMVTAQKEHHERREASKRANA